VSRCRSCFFLKMAPGSRRAYELVGFDSISSYVSALRSTPDNLRKRPLQVRRFDEQQADAKEAQVEMKRVLGAFQLVCLGIGMMLVRNTTQCDSSALLHGC
jgi:hypothetical protein